MKLFAVPQTAIEIKKLSDSGTADMVDISRVISADPGLAAHAVCRRCFVPKLLLLAAPHWLVRYLRVLVAEVWPGDGSRSGASVSRHSIL